MKGAACGPTTPWPKCSGWTTRGKEKKYAYDAEGKLKRGFTSTYLESSGHPLSRLLAVSTVGLPGRSLHVKRTSALEVMRYRLPFMVEDQAHNKWLDWGPPRRDPNPEVTAVAYNKYGQGHALYIGAPIPAPWRRGRSGFGGGYQTCCGS